MEAYLVGFVVVLLCGILTMLLRHLLGVYKNLGNGTAEIAKNPQEFLENLYATVDLALRRQEDRTRKRVQKARIETDEPGENDEEIIANLEAIIAKVPESQKEDITRAFDLLKEYYGKEN